MHRFRDRDPSGEVGFSHFVQVFRREVGASERALWQLKLVRALPQVLLRRRTTGVVTTTTITQSQ
jgi:hypothetical protein